MKNKIYKREGRHNLEGREGRETEMSVLENKNGEPMKLGMPNGYHFVIKIMMLNFSEMVGKLPTTVWCHC
jgi:hypothetical protein